jgi:hypothetical protein
MGRSTSKRPRPSGMRGPLFQGSAGIQKRANGVLRSPMYCRSRICDHRFLLFIWITVLLASLWTIGEQHHDGASSIRPIVPQNESAICDCSLWSATLCALRPPEIDGCNALRFRLASNYSYDGPTLELTHWFKTHPVLASASGNHLPRTTVPCLLKLRARDWQWLTASRFRCH